MPDPTPYEPCYDFTASDKGPQLNVELADVAEATRGLVYAVADIRRADGALKNGIVTADSLAVSVLGQLAPEAIAALDLGEAVSRAEAAQVAAEGSEAGALGAETNAAASAITATTQAGLAATSAATAATRAGEAATQAAAAAASETAAAISAAAAAAASAAPRVAFMAHRNNSDQTGIATGVATKVAANSQVFDQGGFYSTATARWTPSAGRYRITGAALFSAAVVDQQQYRAMVYKNGALFRQSIVLASGTADVTALVSASDVANGTDYYEFFVQGAGTGSKTISGAPADTWFEGSAL